MDQKQKRLQVALQLLEFMRDRYGPTRVSGVDFSAKWKTIYPSPQVLWDEVDDVLSNEPDFDEGGFLINEG